MSLLLNFASNNEMEHLFDGLLSFVYSLITCHLFVSLILCTHVT